MKLTQEEALRLYDALTVHLVTEGDELHPDVRETLQKLRLRAERIAWPQGR